MSGAPLPTLRVGQGFDMHRVSDDPGRPLVLGGVTIPGSPGLHGHSDADVVCHALADALLGAASLGDLGRHFPDTDPRYAGAASTILLREVVMLVAGHGWHPVNADCTVLCQRPRLADHIPAMVERLAGVVGASVSVKATSPEGLGVLGQGEGVACMAVVLLALDEGRA